ncbi:MAG: NUDIX hydrolase [Patescibacteria group bacterium]
MTQSSKFRSKNPTSSKRTRWKTISSRVVHRNAYYVVREDAVVKPDGTKGSYHVVERRGSVFVVAINERQEVCLIGVYKYPTRMYSLEVPAGGCDPGERPLSAAKRELKEETGFAARSWKRLGTYQVLNGFVDEMGQVFLARDLHQTGTNGQAEEGIAEVRQVALAKCLAMIRDGEITDGQSIVALTLAALEFNICV